MYKSIASLFGLASVFAVSIAFSGAAFAADPQIVVAGTNPQTVHAEAVDAANKLCTEARANDPLDDFGSQDECVQNTLDHAQVRHRAYQTEYTQRQISNSGTP